MENIAYFLLFSLSGLAAFYILLLNWGGGKKDPVWRNGIYAVVLLSWYSASGIGISKPVVNPIPCLTFALGVLIMLTCVAYSYYKLSLQTGATQDQISTQLELRHFALTRSVAVLIVIMILSVVVGFMQGQQGGQRVQVSFTDALIRISNEIQSLRTSFNTLSEEVKTIKSDVKILKGDQYSAKEDRNELLRNQKKMMKRK